jgi:hypothetical protein
VSGPNPAFILVRRDGTLDGIPSCLECWRETINEFAATHSDNLAAIDPDRVCFIRARLIEIEEPTLILDLCSAPAWAVRSYKLIGSHT